jgi:hypothetical protein
VRAMATAVAGAVLLLVAGAALQVVGAGLAVVAAVVIVLTAGIWCYLRSNRSAAQALQESTP